MDVDDPAVVRGVVVCFSPADRRPDAATDQALAQTFVLGSDVDGVQQISSDRDELNGDDVRLNAVDGEPQALASKPDPVAACAPRAQQFLA